MSNHAEAAEYYDNPENQEPAPGPAQRLSREPRPTLSEYVPLRLSAESMAALRDRADADGVTVSAWIRRLIESELRRGAEQPATAVTTAIEALEELRRSLDRA